METILCNISDALGIINEYKLEWINNVLLNLNVSEEILSLSVDKYKNTMYELGIDVEANTNGEVNIYKLSWSGDEENGRWLPATKDNLVGQWKEPGRIRRADKDRKVYYEIKLNCWSIFGF